MKNFLKYILFLIVSILYFALINYIFKAFAGRYEGLAWWGILLTWILVAFSLELIHDKLVMCGLFIVALSNTRAASITFVLLTWVYGLGLLYIVWFQKSEVHWFASCLLTVTICRFFYILIGVGALSIANSQTIEQ